MVRRVGIKGDDGKEYFPADPEYEQIQRSRDRKYYEGKDKLQEIGKKLDYGKQLEVSMNDLDNQNGFVGTPSQLNDMIDEYRVMCIGEGRPFTMAGLALHLGLSSRLALDSMGQNPSYRRCIERARLIVESQWEERLNGASATGAIFWLKNHAGYSDRKDIAHHSFKKPTRIELIAGDAIDGEITEHSDYIEDHSDD